MTALLPLILLLQVQSGAVGKFHVADRMKQLDVAWAKEGNRARRMEAVPTIAAAVQQLFRLKYAEAAEGFDDAVARLEGRRRTTADAITLRFDQLFAEPGAAVRIKITWAYRPPGVVPVRVAAGSEEVMVKPGQESVIAVNPQRLNPELTVTREAGYLLPVRVGAEQRHVYVSIVRNAHRRVNDLKNAENKQAADLAAFVRSAVEKPYELESELPMIQYLFTAEQLEEGRSKLWELESLPRGVHGTTEFRAAFPKEARQDPEKSAPVNVVIALHGTGGSPHQFFESFGMGAAATSALDRGWVFVAPKAGERAAQDVLDWLTQVRKLKIGKLFVMGHDSGGGYALLGKTLKPPATAVAAFAPAAAAVPREALNLPLYLTVGAQDIGPVRRNVQAVAQELTARPEFRFQEFDPAEHLMLVAESIPEAYKFFDKYASK